MKKKENEKETLFFDARNRVKLSFISFLRPIECTITYSANARNTKIIQVDIHTSIAFV